jgi:cell shape-determining protein MreC
MESAEATFLNPGRRIETINLSSYEKSPALYLEEEKTHSNYEEIKEISSTVVVSREENRRLRDLKGFGGRTFEQVINPMIIQDTIRT